MVFDCGHKFWRKFKKWPPTKAQTTKLYLHDDGSLRKTGPAQSGRKKSFISDPSAPVPYRKRSDIALRFTPRPYMTDDQRFASGRNDVLVFQTEVLQKDLTLVGPIKAHLKVSTDQSAADWIVKLIDVLS